MIILPEKLKQIDKKQVGVLFLIGVLLIIIAMPTKQAADFGVGDEVGNDSGKSKGDITEESCSEEVYTKKLEEEVQEVLQNVQGVGQVKVMLTLKAGTKRLIEKDYVELEKNSGEIQRNEETIYQEYDGNHIPYVYQETYPEIEGVVVVAEGGENAVVIKNITEAIQALFDVDTHKIKIMKLIAQ